MRSIAQGRSKGLQPFSPRWASSGEDPCKTREVSSTVVTVPGWYPEVPIGNDGDKVCFDRCQRENSPETCWPYGDDQQTLRPSGLSCQSGDCPSLSQVLLWPPKNSVSSAVPAEAGSRRGDDLVPEQGDECPLHLLRNELMREGNTSFSRM